MAFVLVAASGMVSAYASGSSGTKKAKVQTITVLFHGIVRDSQGRKWSFLWRLPEEVLYF